MSAIRSALHRTRNPQSSSFVKLFGGRELGALHKKLFLLEGGVTGLADGCDG